MSRKIDTMKPLSPEDIAYFKARGSAGQAHLNYNELYLRERGKSEDTGAEGEGPEDDDKPLSDEEKADQLLKAKDWIAKANVPQLKEKASEWDLDTSGNKGELQDRLVEAVEKEYGSES